MLIDTQFDVRLADDLARGESFNKHLYRPNTYLHKWWARRCGSTFRLILKHLVEREDDRDYYAPGGLEGKVVLDPMLGGGTTLHEAIRLGANVVGADIDPIPVLQARATLSDLPLPDLEAAFADFWGALRERLSPFFAAACPVCAASAEVQFTLYARRRLCDCGPVLMVDRRALRQERDGSSVQLCGRCYGVGRNECRCTVTPTGLPPLLEKGTTRCRRCGAAYRDDPVVPFYLRYQPIALAVCCPEHGLSLTRPEPRDRERIDEAEARRGALHLAARGDFTVHPGPKSVDLVRQGIHSYLDLFSSRQLLYLHHAIDLLEPYEASIRLNLALLVSTSLEFNSMLCGYKGGDARRPGAIRHTFSHHAYSFPYTALENNPIFPGRVSGALAGLYAERLRRARRWAQAPQERKLVGGRVTRVGVAGEVDAGVEVPDFAALRAGTRRFLLQQGSSATLPLPDDSVDFVVTDPPYFDSVQYGDLAAFFHVWLRHLVPLDNGWQYDLRESAVDPQRGDGRYADLLGAIFRECHRVLRKEQGRLIFTYHHWRPQAWAALTQALRDAGFSLTSCWVVHAENQASVHIANRRALTHDAILVLAPAEAAPPRTWSLPERVDRADSGAFGADCGRVLGWLLQAGADTAQITACWESLLAPNHKR